MKAQMKTWISCLLTAALVLTMVLAAARALLPVREEPRNSNAGQMVEAMLAGVGNKAGDPWCAAAVHHVGTAALGKAWPLPATASCAVPS